MTDPNKKEITTIVKQVLKETGRVSKSSHNPSPTQNKPSGNGPAVLNIFHAGVRKLEEALQQVQQIEETARRSSVYTVESARAWVCGADVKEGAGVKCILDTVKPDGLEKALQKADILILPTFCLRTGAKIASLTCDDQASNLVFTALLMGKKVLATNDGFMLCDILVNEQLRSEIDRILEKLEGFGMIFCQTDQLHATFQNIISGNTRAQSTTHSSTAASEKETAPTIKLITAKVVHAAVDNKQRTIRLATGGIITPLARDLVKEYSIQILKSDE
ncbi:MAG: hypothetical protein ACWGNO_10130 [Desulfobacterales bacterium]